jgi:hypothetical protein
MQITVRINQQQFRQQRSGLVGFELCKSVAASTHDVGEDLPFLTGNPDKRLVSDLKLEVHPPTNDQQQSAKRSHLKRREYSGFFVTRCAVRPLARM